MMIIAQQEKQQKKMQQNIMANESFTQDLSIITAEMALQQTWDRRMGRPTSDGKMCAGKLDPANPHFTNPVPLSETIT